MSSRCIRTSRPGEHIYRLALIHDGRRRELSDRRWASEAPPQTGEVYGENRANET